MIDPLRVKRVSTRFVVALAPALMLVTGTVLACDHGKESKTSTANTQHQEHQQLQSNTAHVDVPAPADRFPTDKHLRKSMSRIESAFADATRGQIPPKAVAVKLGKTVEEGIADIVKHCSLPKEADAALHVIIHEMAAAATQLRSGNDVESAIEHLGHSLAKYRASFDHPLEASAHAH